MNKGNTQITYSQNYIVRSFLAGAKVRLQHFFRSVQIFLGTTFFQLTDRAEPNLFKAEEVRLNNRIDPKTNFLLKRSTRMLTIDRKDVWIGVYHHTDGFFLMLTKSSNVLVSDKLERVCENDITRICRDNGYRRKRVCWFRLTPLGAGRAYMAWLSWGGSYFKQGLNFLETVNNLFGLL